MKNVQKQSKVANLKLVRKYTNKIIITALLCMLFIGTASATIYTKNTTVDYSQSQLIGLSRNYNPSNLADLSIAVTPVYTETSPYTLPASGLLAHWKMDETTGTVVSDSIGSHSSASTVGMAFNTSGKYNGCAVFNGASSLVHLANVTPTTGMTFVAWINQNQSARDIFARYGAANGTKSFIIYTSNTTLNRLAVAISGDGNTTSSFTNTTVGIPINTWSMITVTYDGARVTEYINTNQVINSTTTVTSLYQPANDAYFGNSYINGYYSGRMDNAILYNRALTDTEIKQIYYDSLVNMQFKTNSNAVYSDNITGSGSVDIPYNSGDSSINTITANTAPIQTIDGVTVHDYTNTTSPFTALVTIDSSDVFQYGEYGNGKIAILTDDVYASDYTTYINQISSERNIRGFSAFYGYKADVIDYENATDDLLDDYSTVIAISPLTTAHSNLIQNFTELTGRYAMCTGNVSTDIASRYGLTYTGYNSSVLSVATFSGEVTNNVTTYGSNSRYLYTLSGNAVSNMKTTSGQYIMATSTHGNGKIVFWLDGLFNTRWGSSRVMQNYLQRVAMPHFAVIEGYTPYAQDLAVMPRYDDFNSNHLTDLAGYRDAYVAFYNVTHESTIACPVANLTPDSHAWMPGAAFASHSYEHINLGTLSYEDQYRELLYARNNYSANVGYPVFGLIPPGNGANESTMRILNILGNDVDTWRYVTGIDTSPCTYYYGGNDSDNDVWWIGHRATIEGSTDYSVSGYQTLINSGTWAYDIPLGHPNQAWADYGGITYETVLDHIDTIVDSTNTMDGVYLSTIDDYVKHLDDAKYVSIDEDAGTITVTRASIRGLTLYDHNGVSQNVRMGDTVTIFNRNNKVMLPALTVGVHDFTYSNEYPHITSYSASSVLTNGYYQISKNKMYFTVKDDDELMSGTNVTIEGLSENAVYDLNGESVSTDSNGVLALSNLVADSYVLKSSEWGNNNGTEEGSDAWIFALGMIGVIVLVHFVSRLIKSISGFSEEGGDGIGGLSWIQIDLMFLLVIIVTMGTLTYVLDSIHF